MTSEVGVVCVIRKRQEEGQTDWIKWEKRVHEESIQSSGRWRKAARKKKTKITLFLPR